MKTSTASPVGFVIGSEVRTDSDQTIQSVNPATGQVDHEVFAARPRHVDEAVTVAARAAADTRWRSMLPHARARILYRVGDLVEASAERLALLQMRENGKVFSECLSQATAAAGVFRYFAAVCEVLGSDVTPSRGPYLSLVAYEPYGVVGALTPWNSPLTMDSQKVAPALAAGNAVILKPSETTPTTALELAAMALEGGLPPGLFNVLPGRGDVGATVVSHPGVRMVSFTGGTHTGRAVARAAAARLLPVALELGGKSPHIIFADADIEAAAKGAWLGINVNAGQICSAGSRLFVQSTVYDQAVARLKHLNSTLTIGPGSADCFMGPLVSAEHKQKVDYYLALAEQEGATVHVGGQLAADLPPGSYTRPVLLTGVSNDMRVAREEIFGPVLVIIPFETEDEVVALANDSEYGLAAGLWTSDVSRAHRVAAQLQVGQVYINEYWAGGVETPFGGVKNSGYGREKGVAGALDYTYLKTVTLRLHAEPPSPTANPSAHSELDR
jgi:betaine-aldehyde dehydrogenase